MPITPDIPNYKEQPVSGTSWVRSHTVVIENPYNDIPRITFHEEKIYTLEDGTLIKQPMGNIGEIYNPEDGNHTFLYNIINEEYVRLKERRDNPIPN